MTSPADLLDLSCWKLTLPIGSKNTPTEVKQPALATFSNTDYFCAPIEGGVRFRAPVNGVTTSGSGFPRSELREMKPGGKDVASWSSTSGYHRLEWSEAIPHLPNPRSDGDAGVVGAQIHDAKNDITVFRAEAGKLWLTDGNNTHYKLLDGNYQGARFDGRWDISGGQLKTYFNGKLVDTRSIKGSGWYFKAGAYVQANAKNSKPGDASNYGETVVYALKVTHSDKPLAEPAPPSDPPADPPPAQDPPPVDNPPASEDITVMIIRHGEKPDSKHKGYTDISYQHEDEHSLTANGWVRARDLPTDVFGLPNGTPRAGLTVPNVVIAADGDEAGERMKQTVSYLCFALGIMPLLTWDKGQEKALATALKTMVGKTVVVCWEHGNIPDITKNMGTISPKPPSSWPDDRFDVVFVLKSKDAGKTWAFSQVLEAIGLPGEKKTVI